METQPQESPQEQPQEPQEAPETPRPERGTDPEPGRRVEEDDGDPEAE
jgi:hypothetical protein